VHFFCNLTKAMCSCCRGLLFTAN